MILFENYYVLALIPVLFVIWMLIFRRQSSALEWIDRNVSMRFRRQFTSYGPLSMPAHMGVILFCGILLITAAAGPYVSGKVEQKTKSGDIVIIIDASLSMVAKDAGVIGSKKASRMQQARARAARLIKAFPNHRFALMSFSGLTVVHAPLTRDTYGVRDALQSLSTHAYQQMGSSLKGALARLLTLSADSEDGVQAIIFSDGELPRPEKYDDELAALAAKKIRVHAMALGSKRGVRLKIYDPEQVRRGVARPTVVKTVTTRRKDRDLKRIASRTDGKFAVGNSSADFRVIKKALESGAKSNVTTVARGKKDLSLHFLAAFLFLFLLEILALEYGLRRLARGNAQWHDRAAGRSSSTRDSMSRSALLLLACSPFFASLGGCEIAAWKAHALNEKGLAKQQLLQYDAARPDFEQSAAYQVKEEVPTYNLAAGYMAEKKYKKAHKIYERALRMRPDLAPAYYNDGIALYRWGVGELDVKKCRFKRTKRLWKASLGRFGKSMNLNYAQEKDGQLGDDSRRNLDHVRRQMKELAKLEKECAAKNKNKGGGKNDKDKKDQKKKDQDKQNQNKKDKNKQDQKNKSDKNKKDQDKKKDQNKDKNKGGKNKQDPGKDPNKNKSGKDRRKPRLGDKEKRKVRAALKRIRRQRRGKKFQQSKQQQIQRGKPDGKKKGPGGSPILW